MQSLPWIVAFAASTLLALCTGAWAWRSRGTARRRETLPTQWDLAARPVFSADERRVYRSLREALPHHVLLSKLPLVRFCQPTEPDDVRYWYELLGNIHVAFAVCSANGRVLAAIDLDSDRNGSRRAAQIKQAALGACQVRYLRCAVDHLPSVAELQLLVPNAGVDVHAPQPTPVATAPVGAPNVPTAARHPRAVLWQDTTVFQDSFFNPGEAFDDAGVDPFEAVDGGRPHGKSRETASPRSSLDGGADASRRRPAAPDFEPTRDAYEDDDDLEGPNRVELRASRFFPGFRR